MEVTSLEEHLSELFDPQEAAPIEQKFRKSKTLELYQLEVQASNDWFVMIFAVLKYIVATYIRFYQVSYYLTNVLRSKCCVRSLLSDDLFIHAIFINFRLLTWSKFFI